MWCYLLPRTIYHLLPRRRILPFLRHLLLTLPIDAIADPLDRRAEVVLGHDVGVGLNVRLHIGVGAPFSERVHVATAGTDVQRQCGENGVWNRDAAEVN